MLKSTDKETRYLKIVDDYKEIIAKVCYVYSSSSAPFDDLYQEVLINLWQGIESYRGDAKISTWIYRTAINTCITWHRRNKRHSNAVPLEDIVEPQDDDSANEVMEETKTLYAMISSLDALDKAVVTLWLNEKSYDEIALITGLSRVNVGTRLHRIKNKLAAKARNY